MNSNLHLAKRNKNDEFYTRLTDIENEMRHYREHFRGKVIYCNCDDPYISHFFEYFSKNFDTLGLKKLITTCYRNTDPESRSTGVSDRALKLEYTGGAERSLPNIEHLDITELEGDGDFRSPECVEALQEADIVITNPPFSLFREYVAQLIEHDKQFLLIGSLNAITYKEIFPLIKDNKLWLGMNPVKEFMQPDGSIKKFGNIHWYTNLTHDKRARPLDLFKRYCPEEYPKYDNYDAIEVNRVARIPEDYAGVIGVPITFLDKYCPDQFEILGSDYEVKQGLHPNLINPGWEGKIDRGYVNGVRKYARILIRHRNPKAALAA